MEIMNIKMGTGSGSKTGTESKTRSGSRQVKEAVILIVGLLYGALGAVILINSNSPSLKILCQGIVPREIAEGVEKSGTELGVPRLTQSQAYELKLDPK
jgi:hypothetical protein